MAPVNHSPARKKKTTTPLVMGFLRNAKYFSVWSISCVCGCPVYARIWTIGGGAHRCFFEKQNIFRFGLFLAFVDVLFMPEVSKLTSDTGSFCKQGGSNIHAMTCIIKHPLVLNRQNIVAHPLYVSHSYTVLLKEWTLIEIHNYKENFAVHTLH